MYYIPIYAEMQEKLMNIFEDYTKKSAVLQYGGFYKIFLAFGDRPFY